jgi:hypothetical protein
VPTTSGITNIAIPDPANTDPYGDPANAYGGPADAQVEPARDANGNLIYYDLTGRAAVNPAPGLYLLSTGRKVLLR